jgi:hypothetical protein
VELTVRIAVVLGAAAALVGPGPIATAAADTVAGFQTPSHRIACEYRHPTGQKASLRCDVRDPQSPPARPKSCAFDWGMAFGLSPTGPGRRLCVSDTVLNPKAKVLAYGASRTLGPYTCTSRTTGLRCGTAAHHGFVLSRATQKLF